MLDTKEKSQHALENFDQIKLRINKKKLVFFLDYDGTLTPIVDKPELAVLSEEVRDCLRELSQHYVVAVISGRELSNIRQCVGINSLYYSGNHGLEVAGPNHYEEKKEIGDEFIKIIDMVSKELNESLHDIEGILVENKKLSLSVHYRLVRKKYIERIDKKVDEIVKKYSKLEKRLGKKVFELRPSINWDKGKIVFYLLKQLNLSIPDVVPIYLGDDVTDEDAFRALQGCGVTVLVSNISRESAANYYLKNPSEVLQFLKEFI